MAPVIRRSAGRTQGPPERMQNTERNAMTKKEFREYLGEKPLLLDGATGTNLIRAGLPSGVCPEAWILQHEQVMEELQRGYVEAGSGIIYAPTFTANRIKLSEYGLYDRMEEMIFKLTAISKRAAGGRALVAGDLTMTGKQLKPMGPLDFEELVEIYKEQIGYLVKAGVDLLVVETMMSLQETRAALIAAKEASDLAVMTTLTFEADGRTLFGSDAAACAVTLEALGAAALGANCSTGPQDMLPVIKSMLGCTRLPIIAKPNAGLPEPDGRGGTIYPMTPAEFAEEMKKMAAMGVQILGGCCGTTPEHIRALKNVLPDTVSKGERKRKNIRYLSSERNAFSFGTDSPFFIVGERINPTGKKKLQAELKEGKLNLVDQYIEEQEAAGAAMLDVNVGMGGVDEKALMKTVLEEVLENTSLPLSLDSSDPAVMEEALRRYPGRALVNSVSLEEKKIREMLPLVKKYGAMFILLPLSDEGIPQGAEERVKVIRRILDHGKKLGISEDSAVVDCLVQTVAAAPEGAKDALDTIRWCKTNGFPTVCGLSNVSFGLPERGYVNAFFAAMAIREGLTMAIANPGQSLLALAAACAGMLNGVQGAAEVYLKAAEAFSPPVLRDHTGQMPEKEKTEKDRAGEGKERHPLYEAVLKGKKREIRELTENALLEGESPQSLLNERLMPAIEEVGSLFDQGIYFLPQLIASAEAMKLSLEVLEPGLKAEEAAEERLPLVLIATVRGDIHDIGKNLVALMLKNHGFPVLDLGKDVPAEKILEEAETHHAGVIALSALMTTTMSEMKHVIGLAGERGMDIPFMVGGAVVTEEYASAIGAGYSRDAAEAVKLAKRLVGRE